MPPAPRHPRAFTLIELLVVISIVAILIGLAMPAFAAAQRRARKLTCSANLHSIGLALQTYNDDTKGIYPTARYMPDPFVTTDTNPPLPQLLGPYLTSGTGAERSTFHCPADDETSGVFKLSGTSYMYESLLAGIRLEDFFPVQMGMMQEAQVVVSRDFDGGTFDTTTVGQIIVGPFHGVRNLLFADGHAGNFAP